MQAADAMAFPTSLVGQRTKSNSSESEELAQSDDEVVSPNYKVIEAGDGIQMILSEQAVEDPAEVSLPDDFKAKLNFIKQIVGNADANFSGSLLFDNLTTSEIIQLNRLGYSVHSNEAGQLLVTGTKYDLEKLPEGFQAGLVPNKVEKLKHMAWARNLAARVHALGEAEYKDEERTGLRAAVINIADYEKRLLRFSISTAIPLIGKLTEKSRLMSQYGHYQKFGIGNFVWDSHTERKIIEENGIQKYVEEKFDLSDSNDPKVVTMQMELCKRIGVPFTGERKAVFNEEAQTYEFVNNSRWDRVKSILSDKRIMTEVVYTGVRTGAYFGVMLSQTAQTVGRLASPAMQKIAENSVVSQLANSNLVFNIVDATLAPAYSVIRAVKERSLNSFAAIIPAALATIPGFVIAQKLSMAGFENAMEHGANPLARWFERAVPRMTVRGAFSGMGYASMMFFGNRYINLAENEAERSYRSAKVMNFMLQYSAWCSTLNVFNRAMNELGNYDKFTGGSAKDITQKVMMDKKIELLASERGISKSEAERLLIEEMMSSNSEISTTQPEQTRPFEMASLVNNAEQQDTVSSSSGYGGARGVSAIDVETTAETIIGAVNNAKRGPGEFYNAFNQAEDSGGSGSGNPENIIPTGSPEFPRQDGGTPGPKFGGFDTKNTINVTGRGVMTAVFKDGTTQHIKDKNGLDVYITGINQYALEVDNKGAAQGSFDLAVNSNGEITGMFVNGEYEEFTAAVDRSRPFSSLPIGDTGKFANFVTDENGITRLAAITYREVDDKNDLNLDETLRANDNIAWKGNSYNQLKRAVEYPSEAYSPISSSVSSVAAVIPATDKSAPVIPGRSPLEEFDKSKVTGAPSEKIYFEQGVGGNIQLPDSSGKLITGELAFNESGQAVGYVWNGEYIEFGKDNAIDQSYSGPWENRAKHITVEGNEFYFYNGRLALVTEEPIASLKEFQKANVLFRGSESAVSNYLYGLEKGEVPSGGGTASAASGGDGTSSGTGSSTPDPADFESTLQLGKASLKYDGDSAPTTNPFGRTVFAVQDASTAFIDPKSAFNFLDGSGNVGVISFDTNGELNGIYVGDQFFYSTELLKNSAGGDTDSRVVKFTKGGTTYYGVFATYPSTTNPNGVERLAMLSTENPLGTDNKIYIKNAGDILWQNDDNLRQINTGNIDTINLGAQAATLTGGRTGDVTLTTDFTTISGISDTDSTAQIVKRGDDLFLVFEDNDGNRTEKSLLEAPIPDSMGSNTIITSSGSPVTGPVLLVDNQYYITSAGEVIGFKEGSENYWLIETSANRIYIKESEYADASDIFVQGFSYVSSNLPNVSQEPTALLRRENNGTLTWLVSVSNVHSSSGKNLFMDPTNQIYTKDGLWGINFAIDSQDINVLLPLDENNLYSTNGAVLGKVTTLTSLGSDKTIIFNVNNEVFYSQLISDVSSGNYVAPYEILNVQEMSALGLSYSSESNTVNFNGDIKEFVSEANSSIWASYNLDLSGDGVPENNVYLVHNVTKNTYEFFNPADNSTQTAIYIPQDALSGTADHATFISPDGGFVVGVDRGNGQTEIFDGEGKSLGSYLKNEDGTWSKIEQDLVTGDIQVPGRSGLVETVVLDSSNNTNISIAVDNNSSFNLFVDDVPGSSNAHLAFSNKADNLLIEGVVIDNTFYNFKNYLGNPQTIGLNSEEVGESYTRYIEFSGGTKRYLTFVNLGEGSDKGIRLAFTSEVAPPLNATASELQNFINDTNNGAHQIGDNTQQLIDFKPEITEETITLSPELLEVLGKTDTDNSAEVLSDGTIRLTDGTTVEVLKIESRFTPNENIHLFSSTGFSVAGNPEILNVNGILFTQNGNVIGKVFESKNYFYAAVGDDTFLVAETDINDGKKVVAAYDENMNLTGTKYFFEDGTYKEILITESLVDISDNNLSADAANNEVEKFTNLVKYYGVNITVEGGSYVKVRVNGVDLLIEGYDPNQPEVRLDQIAGILQGTTILPVASATGNQMIFATEDRSTVMFISSDGSVLEATAINPSSGSGEKGLFFTMDSVLYDTDLKPTNKPMDVLGTNYLVYSNTLFKINDDNTFDNLGPASESGFGASNGITQRSSIDLVEFLQGDIKPAVTNVPAIYKSNAYNLTLDLSDPSNPIVVTIETAEGDYQFAANNGNLRVFGDATTGYIALDNTGVQTVDIITNVGGSNYVKIGDSFYTINGNNLVPVSVEVTVGDLFDLNGAAVTPTAITSSGNDIVAIEGDTSIIVGHTDNSGNRFFFNKEGEVVNLQGTIDGHTVVLVSEAFDDNTIDLSEIKNIDGKVIQLHAASNTNFIVSEGQQLTSIVAAETVKVDEDGKVTFGDSNQLLIINNEGSIDNVLEPTGYKTSDGKPLYQREGTEMYIEGSYAMWGKKYEVSYGGGKIEYYIKLDSSEIIIPTSSTLTPGAYEIIESSDGQKQVQIEDSLFNVTIADGKISSMELAFDDTQAVDIDLTSDDKYRAMPDGTVYEVRADGSATKIGTYIGDTTVSGRSTENIWLVQKNDGTFVDGLGKPYKEITIGGKEVLVAAAAGSNNVYTIGSDGTLIEESYNSYFDSATGLRYFDGNVYVELGTNIVNLPVYPVGDAQYVVFNGKVYNAGSDGFSEATAEIKSLNEYGSLQNGDGKTASDIVQQARVYMGVANNDMPIIIGSNDSDFDTKLQGRGGSWGTTLIGVNEEGNLRVGSVLLISGIDTRPGDVKLNLLVEEQIQADVWNSILQLSDKNVDGSGSYFEEIGMDSDITSVNEAFTNGNLRAFGEMLQHSLLTNSENAEERTWRGDSYTYSWKGGSGNSVEALDHLMKKVNEIDGNGGIYNYTTQEQILKDLMDPEKLKEINDDFRAAQDPNATVVNIWDIVGLQRGTSVNIQAKEFDFAPPATPTTEPTASFTPTETLTATSSVTPSPTNTATSTPTSTATVTASASATNEPTNTPNPTNTPTVTPSPTIQPSSTAPVGTATEGVVAAATTQAPPTEMPTEVPTEPVTPAATPAALENIFTDPGSGKSLEILGQNLNSATGFKIDGVEYRFSDNHARAVSLDTETLDYLEIGKGHLVIVNNEIFQISTESKTLTPLYDSAISEFLISQEIIVNHTEGNSIFQDLFGSGDLDTVNDAISTLNRLNGNLADVGRSSSNPEILQWFANINDQFKTEQNPIPIGGANGLNAYGIAYLYGIYNVHSDDISPEELKGAIQLAEANQINLSEITEPVNSKPWADLQQKMRDENLISDIDSGQEITFGEIALMNEAINQVLKERGEDPIVLNPDDLLQNWDEFLTPEEKSDLLDYALEHADEGAKAIAGIVIFAVVSGYFFHKLNKAEKQGANANLATFMATVDVLNDFVNTYKKVKSKFNIPGRNKPKANRFRQSVNPGSNGTSNVTRDDI